MKNFRLRRFSFWIDRVIANGITRAERLRGRLAQRQALLRWAWLDGSRVVAK